MLDFTLWASDAGLNPAAYLSGCRFLTKAQARVPVLPKAGRP
jgi:hypothetical protein